MRDSGSISGGATHGRDHGRNGTAGPVVPEFDGPRFEVLQECGKGAMGVVHLVHDRRLKRDVALKRPRWGDIAGAQDQISLFLNEARAVAALDHENIVRVYDIDKDERGYYVCMEWVGGGTLADLIEQRGKLPVEQALNFFRGICRGVHYAHTKRILHRDIKPSNVLITKDGVPKVADFGLARIGMESVLDSEGHGMGTRGYASPEQCADAKHVDQATDVYSLGATLYAMVTGHPPEIDQVDAEAVPGAIRPAVIRALEHRREDRYYTVAELWSALEAASGHGKHRGAAVAPAAASGAPGVCPSPECGFSNPVDERYCQNCGVGLFERCPKCDHEQHTGRKYCGSCGVNMAAYREYLDCLTAAEEHLSEGEFQEALRLSELALTVIPEDTRARAVSSKVKASQRRFEDLRAAAARDTEGGRFDEAEEALREALALKASDRDSQERLAALPGLRNQAELDSLHASARESLAAGDLDSAEGAIRRALELSPASDTFLAARKALEDARVRGQLTTLHERVSEALEKGWADVAEAAAEQGLQLRPEDLEFASGRDAARALRRRDRMEFLRGDMEACMAGRRYGDASSRAHELLAIESTDDRAREVLDESTAKLRELEALKAEVEDAIRGGLIQDAQRILTGGRDAFPGSADVARRLEEVAALAREEHINSLRSQMCRAYWGRRHADAERLARMLLAEAPDDLVAAKVCKEAPQLAEVARTQRNGRAAGIAAVLALAGAVCVAAISGGRHAERPAPSGASRGPITGVSCLPRDPSLLRGEVHSVEFWPQHPYYTACDSVILRKGDIFTVGATDPAQEYSVDPHVGWMTVHGTVSVQKLARPEQFLHRYAPFGCLLAKIGDSEPITAGDGLVYQAEREGKLFLAVNERAAPNAWADNRTRTGRALIVKVTIQRAQPSG